ncbi:MAG: stage III sporulation AC/AD family protein [Eubacterium sp.]
MIIKLIGISLAVLFCSILLREYNKPFTLILSISAGIIAVFLISDKIYELFQRANELSASVPQAMPYIKLMLKVLCIILVTQFVCDICRDNGENALASFTEIGAKIVVISLIIPLFETIISIVSGLVK